MFDDNANTLFFSQILKLAAISLCFLELARGHWFLIRCALPRIAEKLNGLLEFKQWTTLLGRVRKSFPSLTTGWFSFCASFVCPSHQNVCSCVLKSWRILRTCQNSWQSEPRHHIVATNRHGKPKTPPNPWSLWMSCNSYTLWDRQVRLAWTSICDINVGLLQWHLTNIHIQETLHVGIPKDLPPMFHQIQPHQRLNQRFPGHLAHSKGNLNKAPFLINDCAVREDDACGTSESSRKSGIHQVQKDGIHQETNQRLHHKQGNHSRTVIKHPELLSTMREANEPVSPFPSTDALQILRQSLFCTAFVHSAQLPLSLLHLPNLHCGQVAGQTLHNLWSS